MKLFRSLLWRLAVWSSLFGASLSWAAPEPTPAEFQERDAWVQRHLLAGHPPLAFTLDGRTSAELLAKSPGQTTTTKLADGRVQHTWTWTDPTSGLEVRCVTVEHVGFPAVEWTGYFRNPGSVRTPLLEGIQAIDVQLRRSQAGEFVLRGITGDDCRADSYQPYEHVLATNSTRTIAPPRGKPSEVVFPYFNLSEPGGGMMMAVGWPGQWAASFTRDAADGLRIVAGQELTHLRLEPGEEIRTPLIALLFWRGADVERAQNIWRRWMLADNLPRPGGQPLRPMYNFCSGGYFEGLKVSEASEKEFIDVLEREGIKLDYWWMDAGWYPCPKWWNVGTWEPDAARFPNGLKAVSDYVHGRGTKLIVWFEPERATDGSWLAQNHPEWLIGGKLFNFGDPAARQWMTDHVDQLITEQGIDLYRQDFNMSPLESWRTNDAPDRQGITENLHVQGYLAYWDELRRRHPDMLIDSCAGGGRRNDLETLRRAVPLLRSDYQAFDGNPAYALGNQCHTYGLSSWIPFYGQGVYANPSHYVYSVRSHMSPSFCICIDVRKPGIDWDLYRRLVAEWRQVADCFLGDYYPLTPYSLSEASWIAWQFARPEADSGMVQAFRRAECPDESVWLKLRGLDRSGVYLVANLDEPGTTELTGQELSETGLRVVIKDQPGAAVITYQRKP
ncbi:MAG: alpha-galactosidase [Opitutaceae bacterium]|nr:alpha-galactosidase [Opitutaceae bacterium]MBP9912504.1 alpha-galactosidase [Opitutaceae bacterium]